MLHASCAGKGADSWNVGCDRKLLEYSGVTLCREYIKPDGTVGYRSTKGWYRRVDNNGWRPVAERLLLGQEHQAALPAAAAGSCSGSHGRRLRRKQQRQRHRRLHQQLQTGGRHDEVGSSRLEDNEDAGSSGCEDESEVCSGSSGRSSPVYHYSSIVRRWALRPQRRDWMSADSAICVKGLVMVLAASSWTLQLCLLMQQRLPAVGNCSEVLLQACDLVVNLTESHHF